MSSIQKTSDKTKSRTCTGITKSAPATALKLLCTNVSSRSSTKHFWPISSGCCFGKSLILWRSDSSTKLTFLPAACAGKTACGCLRCEIDSFFLIGTFELDRDELVLVDVSSLSLSEFEMSGSGRRQQHIIRSDSRRVSVPVASESLSITEIWGIADLAGRGVTEFPYLSVWVIKSGVSVSSVNWSFCIPSSDCGEFSIPGDRMSTSLRIPIIGVLFEPGVDAAVCGV